MSGRGLVALQRRAAPAGNLWITDPKRPRAQPLPARLCIPNRARRASPARRIARWVTRTSGSGTVTARVDSGNAVDGCRLCIALLLRRCRCELPIQNFRNCTFPQVKGWEIWPRATRRAVTWHSPIPSRMFLQATLGRTSTR